MIHIELIKRIRKSTGGNKFLNGLLKFFFILIYPVIFIWSLMMMLFFAMIALWQHLTMPRSERQSLKAAVTNVPAHEEWRLFTEIEGLKVFEKYQGEIRFGPAYLSLKTEPPIPKLADLTFGDWFFPYKNGFLLQQWNSTQTPNTNLIFISANRLRVQYLLRNIPSVHWEARETEDNKLQLNYNTDKEILTYIIEI